MARSASTGRFVRRRPRIVGQGRRLRAVGSDFSTGQEAGGVISGETIYLAGGPELEAESKPKTTTKATSSSSS